MNQQTTEVVNEIHSKGGRCNGTFSMDRHGVIYSFSLNGHAVIVWEFPNNGGCDVYAPVSDSIKISETLTALWKRVGL